jgi:hypothetical protein
VGDPGRGDDIAEAVLDDDEARAEIVEPITSSVLGSTGLPADQRPLVAAEVDRVLQDPSGARAFVDPFAGEWARMLGENDPRPSSFDLAPVVDDLAAASGFDASALPAEQLVVPAVPLPDAEVTGLGTVRRTVAASPMPLAVAAVVGFAFAFAFGDRRWVLRRVGIWAVLAGASWVILPALVVWAARRWATGADAVIAVSVEEAVSGLRPTAMVLLLCGVAAIATSFAFAAGPSHAEPEPQVTRRTQPRAERRPPQPAPQRRKPAEHTATMPAMVIPTATMPDHVVARPAASGLADTDTDADTADQADGDELWRFYS